MVKVVDMNELRSEVANTFGNGFMCSETAVTVLNNVFDLGMPKSAIAMSTGFPFGFGDGGNLCGGIAGTTMCLGYVFGRTEPGDPKSQKCLDMVRRLNDDIAESYKTSICPELIDGYDFTADDRKGHCREIIIAAVESFAKIMRDEQGVELKNL